MLKHRTRRTAIHPRKARTRYPERPVLETCPPEKRRQFVHHARKPKSRVAAIALACLQCVAWAREEVRRCEITACALHPFRPYR